MRRALFALTLLALAAPGCKAKKLQAELDATNSTLAQTESDLAGEQNKNKKLTAENQAFETRVSELESELAVLNDQIEDLAKKQGLTAKELADLRADKAKREKELLVYKNLFAELKALVDAGTIEVVFRKGRMTVKLSNAILFDSGKSRLSEEGKAAVAQIVPALTKVGDREFLVAGHTDNVPIRTARYKNNWELSTARAVSMVTEMIEDGYPGGRIGAAGFGEFDPIASNDTDEGKEQNRRIEIILMPNLGEIPGMQQMLKGSKGR